MIGNHQHNGRTESTYRLRFMACVIVAEVIALGFFNLWPVYEKREQPQQDMEFSEDVIAMEDVVMTRQQDAPPPPPRPEAPIPEPKDEIIEEQITELNNINTTDLSDSLSESLRGTAGDSNKPLTNPQKGPSVIRIVEPTVPEAAKKANVKAEIWVTFLVDKQGKVEEATINQIKLYDRDTGNAKTVSTIGYGLPEATINAALQWKFRPAKNDGEIVRAYTKHIFTYGF